MRGRRTKWIFGTDHASIATQRQVERELERLGTSREELGREAFLERDVELARALRRDDRRAVQAPRRLVRLRRRALHARRALRRGGARRVRRAVRARPTSTATTTWSTGIPGIGSAISDLEVEEREETDTLYSIAYPLADGSGEIVVATVRPETMLADTRGRGEPRRRALRAAGRARGRSCRSSGGGCRSSPTSYVKPDFGTGALKITPGHDPNDFEIGRRHGLAELSVIGEDGRMTDAAGERFAGLTRAEARARRSSPSSRRAGALRGSRALHARGPVLASLRRADRAADLAAVVHADGRAGGAGDRRGARRARRASTRIAGRASTSTGWRTSGPWCVSRQLWWGHRLPVYYCDACEETYVARERARALRRLRRAAAPGRGRARHVVLERAVAVRDARLAGADRRAARLLPDRRARHGARHHLPLGRADDHDGDRVHRRGPVRRRLRALGDPGARRAADVEVAGHRHRPARGDRPQRRRRRALRPARDVLDAGRPLQRREGRAGRARSRTSSSTPRASCCSSLGERRPAPAAPAPTAVEDRWILSRLARAERELAPRIERYDFARAAQALYDFVYGELCDWYIELVKARLADAASCARRCATCCGGRCCSRTRSCRSSPRSSGRTCARTARGCSPGTVREPRPSDGASTTQAEAGARAGDRGDAGAAALARRGRGGARGARSRRGWTRTARRAAALLARIARLELRGDGGEGARERSRSPGGVDRDPRGRRPRGARGAPSSASARSSTAEIARVRGEARQRGVRRQRARRRWSPPSARSSSELRARARGAVMQRPASGARSAGRAEDAERHLLGARALRHALRARPHAPADDRARAADACPTRPIHVVGTNGKSSTTRMIAALLERHGLRTGCFTSPHLLSYRERIRIGERDIAPERFARGDRADGRGGRARRPHGGRAGRRRHPVRAADRRARSCEFARGGRRRRGARGGARRPLRRDQHRRLARRRADQRRARAHALPRADGARTSRSRSSTSCGPARRSCSAPGPTRTALAVARTTAAERGATLVDRAAARSRLQLRADGAYQHRNFAAAAAAAQAFLGRELDARRRSPAAAAAVVVPGRFEVHDGPAGDVFDGAHNDGGIEALAESLPAFLAGRRLVVVVSILDDKDAGGHAAAAARALRRGRLRPRCSSPRALPAATLASLAGQLGGERGHAVADPHARAGARARARGTGRRRARDRLDLPDRRPAAPAGRAAGLDPVNDAKRPVAAAR